MYIHAINNQLHRDESGFVVTFPSRFEVQLAAAVIIPHMVTIIRVRGKPLMSSHVGSHAPSHYLMMLWSCGVIDTVLSSDTGLVW